MMYAFFSGCKIPFSLKEYETATRAVMEDLDIRLLELEFNCCGYPTRHRDEFAALYASARNFALAGAAGVDILTPCKCCYGQLKHAAYWLKREPRLLALVAQKLSDEGLTWRPATDAHHLLSVLFHTIGVERIRQRIRKPLTGLKLAAHYGCHALRPGHITQFDNPFAPTLFEKLVAATGAESVDWPMRLECCGNPLRGKNDALSSHLMFKKLKSAAESGADAVCTACTHCQLQFKDNGCDSFPKAIADPIPAKLYIEVLAESMGLGK